MRILEKFYIDGFIVAMLGAVALGWLLPLSGHAGEILSWTTKFAVGLLFLMYGARLSAAETWSGLRNWRLHLTTLGLTYAVYPLLGLAFAATFGRFLPADLATGIVFLTLVPATVQSCIAYTGIAHGNVPAAVVAASTSSIVGVFLTPLLAAMMLGSTGHVRLEARAVISIVVQLLLPFVVGQLLHSRVGGFMRRNDAMLRRADRSFVLLVVFSAFSTGTAAGIWGSLSLARFGLLIVVSVSLLLTALALTILSGRLLGFSRADQIVIMFVGTSKSITAGLPIAAVLFPGTHTALIIVPLMIYHQVKLIVCAVLAQHLGRQAPDPVAEQSAP
jgi:solute carrier family 10 (sodium/bile acid cotransporter), member 7